ncbi:MAG: PDZ domain-containing protein [Planctomycetes bacterium]|jgi:carboxyl-terminal processing protease|nr:PDZ domain-containing protein [Phycisphaerae bacterium]NBB94664.1 PDZ domain-containing protein [Planctomycetota bacterium]
MPRRHFIWILITLAMASALLVVWHRPTPGPTPADGDFQDVQTAYDLIRDAHYEPPAADRLQRGAVRGMVETLDEFSTYVLPEQADLLADRVYGSERGLGLRLDFAARRDVQAVPVLGVLPRSPAAKAGLRPGDVLLAINDTPVTGLAQQRIEQLLDPPGDDAIALTVHRKRAETPVRTLAVSPASFRVQTCQGLYLDADGRWVFALMPKDIEPAGIEDACGPILYIRIREFCPQTLQQLQETLRARTPPPAGLALDLRGNPGGLLEDAIAAAELFLDSGDIVTVIGRNNGPRVHRAHDDTPYGQMRMVVLVDGETASAAELLAGSLAANARAIVIGTRTRGKGCVQSMIRLPGQLGQINLTTKEFRVVPDRPIQRHADSDAWGIDPHIRQPLTHAQATALHDLRRRGEILPPPPEESDPDDTDTADARLVDALKADPQLRRATELLGDPAEYARRIDIIAADVERARKLRQAAEAGREQDDD